MNGSAWINLAQRELGRACWSRRKRQFSALFRVVNRYVGNLALMPGVFPDYKADRAEWSWGTRVGHRALGHAVVLKGADGCHQEPS